MSEIQSIQPKVFCSYSWTNQEYQERILSIAGSLMEAGIEVLLDKWDLVEGADTHAYMEKAISDKSITHVLIFSDSGYVQKANNRSGGVGKETLIITAEVYGQEDVTCKEQRYLPIVMEKDESGQACLPVYLKGRYYIDMSADDLLHESFEQLVRAIYGKPIHKKPQIGRVPSYIKEETTRQSGLTILKKSAIASLRDYKPCALNRCAEYFEGFLNQLDELRLSSVKVDNEFDEIIISLIGSMTQMKDECFDVISTIIKNFKQKDYGETIHTFFENFVAYTRWPENEDHWNEAKVDHFKFVLHELFLYSTACCLKYNNGIILWELIADYYCRGKFNKRMASYGDAIIMNMPTLEHRGRRLGLGNGVELRADMIDERLKQRIDLRLEYVMQADLFLFLQSRVHKMFWKPITLSFAWNQDYPFEFFARAQAKDKCESLLELLGCKNIEELKKLFFEDEVISSYSPSGWFNDRNLEILCGLNSLGTKS